MGARLLLAAVLLLLQTPAAGGDGDGGPMGMGVSRAWRVAGWVAIGLAH